MIEILWIIIKVLFYPFLFSFFWSILTLCLGIIISISIFKEEEQWIISIGMKNWIDNSRLKTNYCMTRILLYLFCYFSLFYLIRFLIQLILFPTFHIPNIINWIILPISSYIFYKKLINPLLVKYGPKYLPGFQEESNRRKKIRMFAKE